MIKVGIIGCGRIADQHINHISNIADCEIIGVCDREILMAKQVSERYRVKRYYADVGKLLEEAHPDVVHITTPPQSHFDLGKFCLESGCHVYIEKPFALNADEVEKLIGLATEKDLKITVGYNAQFSNVSKEMRDLVKGGFLGGPPLHMESTWCYDLRDEHYAKTLLEDKSNWIWKLPGKLLQNILPHSLSKIVEFLPGDSPKVIAHGSTSAFLRGIGITDIVDELRVIIYDGNCTAYLTFSSQFGPSLRQFRIYGPQNSIVIDEHHQTLIKLENEKYKSYLNYIIPPRIFAKQYRANSINNIKKFLQRDLYADYGMRFLIESFYRSITENTPVPIPYREILSTAKIMDDIFNQIET